MKIITINLPEKYLDAIQILINMRHYPSRSEAIRTALGFFLKKEVMLDQELKRDSLKMLIRSKTR